MQVIEETPSKMVLQEEFSPSALFILDLWQIETWSFDKNSQILSYEQRNSLGIKNRCHHFGNIAKVEVEEYLDGDRDKNYNLNLLLPSDSINYLLMHSFDTPRSCIRGDSSLPAIEKMAQKLSDLTGVPISKKLEAKA